MHRRRVAAQVEQARVLRYRIAAGARSRHRDARRSVAGCVSDAAVDRRAGAAHGDPAGAQARGLVADVAGVIAIARHIASLSVAGRGCAGSFVGDGINDAATLVGRDAAVVRTTARARDERRLAGSTARRVCGAEGAVDAFLVR